MYIYGNYDTKRQNQALLFKKKHGKSGLIYQIWKKNNMQWKCKYAGTSTEQTSSLERHPNTRCSTRKVDKLIPINRSSLFVIRSMWPKQFYFHYTLLNNMVKWSVIMESVKIIKTRSIMACLRRLFRFIYNVF